MSIVSIIIVNYNGIAYTRMCLESLFRYHSADMLDVIVVDNHSQDGSVETLKKEFPAVNVEAMTKNNGFGCANNEGVKKAKGEILFFVNNDTLFLEETVSALSSHLIADPKNGIVGPTLLNEDRTFQLSFGDFPSILSEFRMKRKMADPKLLRNAAPKTSDDRKVNWVTGAAFMIRKSLYESLGGFDERYFLYFEDIDLNRRVHTARYHNVYCPSVRLIHLGGRSYGAMNPAVAFEYRRSQLHYYDTHASFAERILIRTYIALKYSAMILKPKERPLISRIMKLLWTKQ